MARPHVAVVGAGAFGGWTALALLRLGAEVTLIDAWGAGNNRASSGGETRLIRSIYGPDACYIHWVAQSFAHWHQLAQQTHQRLFEPRGALWMFHDSATYADASMPHLKELALKVEQLTPHQAEQRFPQVRFDDIACVYLEHNAGLLYARRSCQALLQQFLLEGGSFLNEQAQPGAIHHGHMEPLLRSLGTLKADHYVFAAGPWLGALFPELIGPWLHVTRQEVFFYGLEPGDRDFGNLPVWMDFGERIYYGVPDAAARGFKAGDDSRGPTFEPTLGDRSVSSEAAQSIRERVQWRFPKIGSLPLLESRVCQYENTPDGHFILDRHPEANNLWLLGGGSGHGFKLGPALGHDMAARILADGQPDPKFTLGRFGSARAQPSQLQAG